MHGVVTAEIIPADAQSMRQAIEKTPDAFRINRVLGEGEFGTVYLVFSLTWKRFLR